MFPYKNLYLGPEIPCFLNLLVKTNGCHTRMIRALYILGTTKSKTSSAKIGFIRVMSSIERTTQVFSVCIIAGLVVFLSFTL